MIVEVTKIRMEKVRAKCIERDWYTRGTCDEYDVMLRMCQRDWEDAPYSIQLLERIAEDIYEHSNPDRWEGYDEDPILNIMFELKADCCYSYFEKV